MGSDECGVYFILDGVRKQVFQIKDLNIKKLFLK